MKTRLVQLEVPDYDLGLRGKLVAADKLAGGGVTFCTIVHGLSLTDDVTDTPTSNAANGYPDAPVLVDESTRVELPWRGGAEAVIGDLVDVEGAPLPASARGQVLQLQHRFESQGLVPVLGYEYEVWLFENERDPATGRLRPLGTAENAYSLSRANEVLPLATEFVGRMESIGAAVEAFHSELGPGFFEFALKPQPALKAADGAARARQYFRDLAAEKGIRASFMAKPYADRSGAGGHVHTSVARDGTNVFADRPGSFSPTGASYVGGLLATLADLTVMLNPFVNSYTRLDKEMFVAEQATWGLDDRSAACRVLLDSVGGARVEHRRPGADVSPYLAAAAILGGGWTGVSESLELPPAQDSGSDGLPGSLETALERFSSSPLPKTIFGEEFREVFAATRKAELARYQDWLGHSITDWETRRYQEHL
jgi:glutamine synthetase